MASYQYQYGFPNYQQPNYQNQNSFYQPSQPQIQPQIQPQVQNTGILFVDGDRGAEEFQMIPNTFAFLKSTDGKAVYFKQSLANGATTCEKYILGQMAQAQQQEYITRAEFDEFRKSLEKENRNESNESAI